MSKYYTPDREEFHVGFEYQSLWGLEGINEEWHDEVYSEKDCVNNLCGTLRVKHLDREDIESLGGVKIKDVHNGKHPSYDCFSFERPKYEWFVVMFNYTDNWCTIHMENHTEDIRFYGAIKNKSELKKVLKMLGI